MRSDALYLADIVQAADAIARFVEGMDEPRFVGDDLVRSAVLHKLTVIGEAAARVSGDLRQSHPDVPGPTLSDSATLPSTPTSQSIGGSFGTRP
jgi:uncharacterized protein with HEPN domain